MTQRTELKKSISRTHLNDKVHAVNNKSQLVANAH